MNRRSFFSFLTGSAGVAAAKPIEQIEPQSHIVQDVTPVCSCGYHMWSLQTLHEGKPPVYLCLTEKCEHCGVPTRIELPKVACQPAVEEDLSEYGREQFARYVQRRADRIHGVTVTNVGKKVTFNAPVYGGPRALDELADAVNAMRRARITV